MTNLCVALACDDLLGCVFDETARLEDARKVSEAVVVCRDDDCCVYLFTSLSCDKLEESVTLVACTGLVEALTTICPFRGKIPIWVVPVGSTSPIMFGPVGPSCGVVSR